MTTPEADKLARRITKKLFVNGFGDQATRLVLELENGRDGGGWCEEAVVDVIRDTINEKT